MIANRKCIVLIRKNSPKNAIALCIFGALGCFGVALSYAMSFSNIQLWIAELHAYLTNTPVHHEFNGWFVGGPIALGIVLLIVAVILKRSGR